MINHDMVHHHPSSHNQLLVTDLNFTGAAHVSYISCVCLPVLYGTRLAQGEYRCSTQCSARRLLIIQQNQRTVEGLNIGMKPMMTQHILGECCRVGHYSLYIQSLVRRSDARTNMKCRISICTGPLIKMPDGICSSMCIDWQ